MRSLIVSALALVFAACSKQDSASPDTSAAADPPRTRVTPDSWTAKLEWRRNEGKRQERTYEMKRVVN